MWWLVAVVLIALLIYIAAVYNRFVSLKNAIENTFNQIRVAMKKRFDMIAQLVEAASSYVRFEKDVMEGVARLRSANLQGAEELEKADAEARAILGRIVAVAENYPQLRSIEAVTSLQEAIKQVEEEIARLRYLYNDQVQTWNMMVERIPTNIVAALFGFGKKNYLHFGEEIEKRPSTKVY